MRSPCQLTPNTISELPRLYHTSCCPLACRVFEKHIQTARNAGANLLHVASETAEDVAFLGFGEITQRKVEYLVVYLALEIHNSAVADGRHVKRAHISEKVFEKSADNHKQSDIHKRGEFAVGNNHVVKKIVEIRLGMTQALVTQSKVARILHHPVGVGKEHV